MRPKKAQEIAEILAHPKEPKRGYLARELVLCGLPMRDPKRSSYTRINGDYTLSLQTGLDTRGQEIGLPYGSIPRLLLYWFVSEAIRTKSRHLHMGSTTNGFLRAIGLDPGTGGGKRGDVARLKEQWQRLVRCRITFSRLEGDAVKGSEKTRDMLVSEASETWWDFSGAGTDSAAATFDGSVLLSQAFYEAITSSPVPFDFRAMCALKSSPFAIDLYVWLTWRVYALGKSGDKQAAIPIRDLTDQLGSTYSDLKNFRAAVAEGLEAVKRVWPTLNYELSATRLVLKASPVPIADATYLKKSRALAEVKPDQLSVRTEVWFRSTYPKHSFFAVKKGYRVFLAKNQITPHDIDAHFRDYAQKWVENEF